MSAAAFACAHCGRAMDRAGAYYSLVLLVPVERLRQLERPPLHGALCSLACVAGFAAAREVGDELAAAQRRAGGPHAPPERKPS